MEEIEALQVNFDLMRKNVDIVLLLIYVFKIYLLFFSNIIV